MSIRGLAAAERRVFAETVAHRLLGWGQPDLERQMARLTLRTLESPDWELLDTEMHRVDVSDLAVALSVPTLILQPRHTRFPAESCARAAAMAIRGSQVRSIENQGRIPMLGDELEGAEAILSFIASSQARQPPAPITASPFQTILFTDLESSTALTQRLGDEGAQEVLRGHNATVRAALEAHGGREVKHTGDGIMAAFPSAVRAVEAALQIQRDLAGGEVRVRVGLNAGEPIAEDNDLFGTAVQLAARICDRADPGQVLVSNVVRELCAGKRLMFTHHSDATLKGFAEPVALYEVGN